MENPRQDAAPGRVHIRGLSMNDLKSYVASYGEPEYRFRQVARWLYTRLADDFGAMTDLPLEFRERLEAHAVVRSLETVTTQTSDADGTTKFLFELGDGARIESVLMPYGRRLTLCVSSQVGCPLDCAFCRTGQGGFARNLTAGEILDQVCHLKRVGGAATEKVNLVFMGMGEPLLNYNAVVQAVRVLNDEMGLDMGSRRITVSTAGLPRRIRDLAGEGLRCSLALSLNATTDTQRAQLMPAVSKHPIAELLDAAEYYHKRTSRRVTVEYVLLRGVNTSDADAARLGGLVKGRPFKLNLIPYNAGRDGSFEALPEDELQHFIRLLLPAAPAVTVRRSRGPDIDAACGQLWTRTPAGGRAPTHPG